MSKELEKATRRVRIRLGLNLLIHLTGWAIVLCGILYFPYVLIEKLLAHSFLPLWAWWAVFIMSVPCVFISWFLFYPGSMQAAILLDGRLGLKERVSTALALNNSQDAFARAACQEARKTVETISLKGHFPIRPTRCWLSAGGIWVFLILIAVFLPQQDLLGFLKEKKDNQERLIQLQAAQKQIEQSFNQVSSIVKQLGNSELSSELAKFEVPPTAQLPEEAMRDAIKKLDDLSDRLKQMQKEQSPEMMANMEKMLSQLKTESMNNPLSEVIRAMSKGDFKQAAAMLEMLQRRMEKEGMTPEEKLAIKQAFGGLAKQLEQLAAQQKELEKELQKLGLDKELAKVDPEQLKKIMEKQGYKPETIEQLINKMKACQSACKRCSGLAGMAGTCAGEGGNGAMDAMLSELNELDKLSSMAQINRDALQQIDYAKMCLGKGMCQGMNQGMPQNGIGTGTAGPGLGPRNVDAYDPDKLNSTQVKGKTAEDAPMVASWYFKDSQEKGQATRELKEVIQSSQNLAAQAIEENQIPQKYEKAMKQYFGNLEEESK